MKILIKIWFLPLVLSETFSPHKEQVTLLPSMYSLHDSNANASLRLEKQTTATGSLYQRQKTNTTVATSYTTEIEQLKYFDIFKTRRSSDWHKLYVALNCDQSLGQLAGSQTSAHVPGRHPRTDYHPTFSSIFGDSWSSKISKWQASDN